MSWWHNLPAEAKEAGSPSAAEKPPLVADHFLSRLFGKQAAPLGGFVLEGPKPAGGAGGGAGHLDPSALAPRPVPQLKAAGLLRKGEPKPGRTAHPPPRDALAAAADDDARDEHQLWGSRGETAPATLPAASERHASVRDLQSDDDASPAAPAAAVPSSAVPRPTAAATAVHPAPERVNEADFRWTVDDAGRNKAFFLEWRITDAALCAALAATQQRLQAAAGGNLVVLQSCAADNLHVTMNEWTMDSAADVARAMRLLRDEFSPRAVASRLAAQPPAVLKGIEHFNDRVFYVPVVGPGLDALSAIFRDAGDYLRGHGFKLKPVKGAGGGLVAHITLGKTRPTTGKARAIHAAIDSLGLRDKEIGRTPVSEIVFCVKRVQREATPPVLLTLPAALQGGSVPDPIPSVSAPAPAAAASDGPKVVASALVVMPAKSLWAPFVRIKRKHHQHMSRPPYPHLTLLPSCPPPTDRSFAATVRSSMARLAPFSAEFRTMTLFERPTSGTLFLAPEDVAASTRGAAAAFHGLHKAASVAAGGRVGDFEPHLAVGLIKPLSEAKRLRDEYQKSWQPLRFDVTHVYHITRTSADAPWVVSAAYALGANAGVTPPVPVGETTDSSFVR